ncbi:type IV secretory system conjugative DNA transfer family protein [Alloscardovia venturai]|uniref:Type IV secretory system conjugative DNA transfer family protein n=1 Tax=Alloscardovia venturai TaxID=1769421 RepID=A0ABW2Y9X0_9BIFI
MSFDNRRIGIDTITTNEKTHTLKQKILYTWSRFKTTRLGFILLEHTGFVRKLAQKDNGVAIFIAPGMILVLLGILCMIINIGFYPLFIGLGLPLCILGLTFWWAYGKSEQRYLDDLTTRQELMTQHDVIEHVSSHSLSKAAEHVLPEIRENGWPKNQPIPARWMGVSIGTCHGVNVWASSEQPLYVLGPARSGKTTSIVVPLIVEAPGAVVATSSRRDIIDNTYRLRSQGWSVNNRYQNEPSSVNPRKKLHGVAGHCHLFDPLNVAGSDNPAMDESLPPRLNWNPIAKCVDPVVARACAENMVNTVGIKGDNQSWANAAIDIVQGLLLAAALEGKTLEDVYQWSLSAQSCQTAAKILRRHSENGTAVLWASSIEMLVAEDARITSSKMLGVTGAFSSLSIEQVRAAVTPANGEPLFDIDRFVQSHDTVYLLSQLRPSAGASAASAGVFLTMFLTQVRDAARRIAPTKSGGRLQPPLTLVLDEIANIEPWQELPQLFTAGTGEGIWPCAFFQSRKQAQDAYHEAEGQMWESSNKIIMGGLSIEQELREISLLTGYRRTQHTDESYNANANVFSGASSSIRSEREAVLEPDEVRRLPYGNALNLHTSHRPGFIQLIPFWMRDYKIDRAHDEA